MYGPALADKEKICAELTAKGVKLKNAESVRALKVGMARPNTWGFYDVINNGEPFVLDRIAPNSKMRKLKLDEKGNLLNISYADVETDPLCWEDEENAVNLRCDQSVFWMRHACGDYGWIETFRVCLGPDLIAEKKAKGK